MFCSALVLFNSFRSIRRGLIDSQFFIIPCKTPEFSARPSLPKHRNQLPSTNLRKAMKNKKGRREDAARRRGMWKKGKNNRCKVCDRKKHITNGCWCMHTINFLITVLYYKMPNVLFHLFLLPKTKILFLFEVKVE